MNLSENFTLEELTRSETAKRLKITNSPNPEQLKNLKILCTQVLQPARNAMRQPLIISSGFRSKELNKAVGGVTNSYHLQGMAADIKCNDVQFANKLADSLIHLQLVDLVLIEYAKTSLWVHVQWSRNPRHLINRKYAAI